MIFSLSLVELCVAQRSRSQVTGRKEAWKRGCVLMSSCLLYIEFSQDVTAAILVSQTSPVEVELFSYVNAGFYSHKFA